MQQLIISRDGVATRVALLEDGRAVELYVEPLSCPSIVGNIYKGRVQKVLAGMDAAFVDIGLERNGFLAVDEVNATGERGKASRRSPPCCREAKKILVQVARDAMGGKGPRLTTQLLVVGRQLIYSPVTRASGASRRLAEAERARLRLVCGGLDLDLGGLIARTAAEGAEAESLGRELRFLRLVWAGIEHRATTANAPSLDLR